MMPYGIAASQAERSDGWVANPFRAINVNPFSAKNLDRRSPGSGANSLDGLPIGDDCVSDQAVSTGFQSAGAAWSLR